MVDLRLGVGVDWKGSTVHSQEGKLKRQKPQAHCGVVSPGSDYHTSEKTGPFEEVSALYAGSSAEQIRERLNQFQQISRKSSSLPPQFDAWCHS
jgi:hypothetical protein